MKKFKIPVRVETIAYVTINAKDLNEACYKAMDYNNIPHNISNLTPVDALIPIVDDRKLQELYPKEYNRMKEDEKPYWKKMGWEEAEVDVWTKKNATIENTFNDVGWGFQGTVWIGSDGKSGFTSLESAIDYAEKNMNGE